MLRFDHQTVLILGLGETGLAAARTVHVGGGQVRVADSRQEQAMGEALTTLRAIAPQAEVHFGAFSEALLDGVALVVISPGLSLQRSAATPLVQAAQARGIAVVGEIELFARALAQLKAERGYVPRVVGITGTNGKTTVTRLLGLLLTQAGRKALVAGNISPSAMDTLLDAVARDELPDTWVLELSSFQLATTTSLRCDAAVVLNVTQDHLDWHGTLAEYAAAKARIFGPPPVVAPARRRGQSAALAAVKADAVAANVHVANLEAVAANPGAEPKHGELAAAAVDPTAQAQVQGRARAEPAPPLDPVQVLNADDPLVTAMAHGSVPPVTFGAGAPTQPDSWGLLRDGGLMWLAYAEDLSFGHRRRKAVSELPGVEAQIHVHRLMPTAALRVRGQHNALNVLAALAVARSIGAPLAPMLHALRIYTGEPHRVQTVASVNGVDFIDDSKGTNVGATVAAVVGLGQVLANGNALVVILGGDGKGQDFSPLALPLTAHARAVVLIGRDAPAIFDALTQAGAPCTVLRADTLEAAVAAAAAQARPGDAVLLSPACASLDMFRNYRHRAEVFVAAVQAHAQAAAHHGQDLGAGTADPATSPTCEGVQP